MADSRFRRADRTLCWTVCAALAAHGSCALAAEPMLMFSTQDANGFHMLTFGHGAVAVLGRSGSTKIDRIEDYPARKAQRLWDDIDRLAKDGLNVPVDPAHLHPELNYVILLQAADGTRRDLSFPKCAHDPRVDEVMKRLATGLLPPGSPGIYPGTCTGEKAS